MNWDDIQHHLEPDNIGTAPIGIKLGVFIILFVIIIAAGIYFDTQDQLKVLERHEKSDSPRGGWNEETSRFQSPG